MAPSINGGVPGGPTLYCLIPTSFTMSLAPQAVTQFLVEAHHITTEATFIINSLHNAELPAVDALFISSMPSARSCYIWMIPTLYLKSSRNWFVHVDNLLIPLGKYLASPLPPPNANCAISSLTLQRLIELVPLISLTCCSSRSHLAGRFCN